MKESHREREQERERERESSADAIQFSRLIWPLCNPYCVQVGSLTPSDVGYIPVGQELNVVAVAPGEEAVAAGAAGGVQVASQPTPFCSLPFTLSVQ